MFKNQLNSIKQYKIERKEMLNKETQILAKRIPKKQVFTPMHQSLLLKKKYKKL